jgi:hypothetical protein
LHQHRISYRERGGEDMTEQDGGEYRVRVKESGEIGVASIWGEYDDGEIIYTVVFGEHPHVRKSLIRESQLEFLGE